MQSLVKVKHQIYSIAQLQNKSDACKKENSLIDSFQPKIEKKVQAKKKKGKVLGFLGKSTKCRQIRWNRDEDLLYVNFMKQNEKLFSTQGLRRTGRVFMRLSKQMNGLRSSNQCKSHHQKMVKVTKSGNIRQVIAYLQNKHFFFPHKYSQQKVEGTLTKLDLSKEGEQKIKMDVYPTKRNIQIKIWIDIDNTNSW